ncbi:MAG: archaeosortase/exosortase family protein [Cyclobacteriaceae bacterium]|nr:archaeosortase/exosortase family protein [Cyclobacteriaceae bacterium]
MIEKAKSFISHNREVIRFLGAAFILLLAWVLFSSFFPSAIQDMHYFVIKPQADASAYFLRLFGFEIVQDYLVDGCEARLIFVGYGNGCIGKGCSGLELFLLFFGFILLMKGRLKDKLWFVPLGLSGILVLNIIRIVVLSIIYYNKPQYLDFNHKYTFVIIVYGAIFGLWLLWVNKFASAKE